MSQGSGKIIICLVFSAKRIDNPKKNSGGLQLVMDRCQSSPFLRPPPSNQFSGGPSLPPSVHRLMGPKPVHCCIRWLEYVPSLVPLLLRFVCRVVWWRTPPQRLRTAVHWSGSSTTSDQDSASCRRRPERLNPPARPQAQTCHQRLAGIPDLIRNQPCTMRHSVILTPLVSRSHQEPATFNALFSRVQLRLLVSGLTYASGMSAEAAWSTLQRLCCHARAEQGQGLPSRNPPGGGTLASSM